MWPLRSNRALTELKMKPGPAPLLPPRPPAALELVQVLGIGASQTVAEITLTLLSVERYTNVCIVHFRLVGPRQRGREFLLPELLWSITDGLSSDFTRSPLSSGGGGREDRFEYRMSYAFWPAPATPTDIVFDVHEIAWQRLRPGHAERQLAMTTTGPWRFVVHVEPAT